MKFDKKFIGFGNNFIYRCSVLLVTFVAILTLCSFQVFAFSDVDFDNPYFDAIMKLSEKGMIGGYEDRTFRPKNKVTREEFAAMMCKAFDYKDSSSNIEFEDINQDRWSYPYIMAMKNANMMNGMENGLFKPTQNVTNYQIYKIMVSLLGLEDEAIQRGGWPKGYLEVAKDLGLEGAWNADSQSPVTRDQVAGILYQTMNLKKERKVSFKEKNYYFAMPANELEKPIEILQSAWKDVKWYVYGSDQYKDFYAIGVKKDRVYALVSVGFGCKNLKYYEEDHNVQKPKKGVTLYEDKYDFDKVHTVLIVDDMVSVSPYIGDFSGESKMNFYCSNAFRVFHGRNPLKWDERAAKTARLHSEDLAKNNYFDHVGLNGSLPQDRMRAQGIDLYAAAENVAAGRSLGIESYHDLINSSGHRNNILSERYEYMGVGIAKNDQSDYIYYHTQNFYSKPPF